MWLAQAQDLPEPAGADVQQLLLDVGAAAAAVTVILTLASVAWRRVGRPLRHFLADWAGEPPRPGYPGRPGVPERLERLEVRVANVEAELSPNGGRSVRDRVEALARHAGVEGDETGG